MNSLIRFSPRSNMRSLQHQIDRVFDDFFDVSDENGSSTSAVWRPRVDLSEGDDAYLIHVDVPGLKKEDLDINFQDDLLIISGERRSETSETDEERNYMRVERSFGRFHRSFRLPNTVEPDEIEARYENGVLEVHIPKAEKAKPHRITVA